MLTLAASGPVLDKTPATHKRWDAGCEFTIIKASALRTKKCGNRSSSMRRVPFYLFVTVSRRRHSPDFPPDFSSSLRSVISRPLDAAFNIS